MASPAALNQSTTKATAPQTPRVVGNTETSSTPTTYTSMSYHASQSTLPSDSNRSPRATTTTANTLSTLSDGDINNNPANIQSNVNTLLPGTSNVNEVYPPAITADDLPILNQLKDINNALQELATQARSGKQGVFSANEQRITESTEKFVEIFDQLKINTNDLTQITENLYDLDFELTRTRTEEQLTKLLTKNQLAIKYLFQILHSLIIIALNDVDINPENYVKLTSNIEMLRNRLDAIVSIEKTCSEFKWNVVNYTVYNITACISDDPQYNRNPLEVNLRLSNILIKDIVSVEGLMSTSDRILIHENLSLFIELIEGANLYNLYVNYEALRDILKNAGFPCGWDKVRDEGKLSAVAFELSKLSKLKYIEKVMSLYQQNLRLPPLAKLVVKNLFVLLTKTIGDIRATTPDIYANSEENVIDDLKNKIRNILDCFCTELKLNKVRRENPKNILEELAVFRTTIGRITRELGIDDHALALCLLTEKLKTDTKTYFKSKDRSYAINIQQRLEYLLAEQHSTTANSQLNLATLTKIEIELELLRDLVKQSWVAKHLSKNSVSGSKLDFFPYLNSLSMNDRFQYRRMYLCIIVKLLLRIDISKYEQLQLLVNELVLDKDNIELLNGIQISQENNPIKICFPQHNIAGKKIPEHNTLSIKSSILLNSANSDEEGKREDPTHKDSATFTTTTAMHSQQLDSDKNVVLSFPIYDKEL